MNNERNRARAILTWVVLALGLIALPAMAGEFEAGKVRFEDLVPSDSYLCLSFEGLHECEKAMEQSGLYRTWKEPEFQSFVSGLVQMVRHQLAQASEGGSNVPFEQIRGALQGRVAVAVGDMTMVGLMIPTPAFVLSIDTGNRREMFQQLLEGAIQEAGEHLGSSFERTSFDYNGQKIHALPCPKLKQTQLCYTFVDNLFLLGLNKYYLQRMIDNRQGRGSSLSKDPAFRRSVANAGSGTILSSIFVNFNGFKGKLHGLTPPELSEVAGELGVANLNSLYFASATNGTGSRDIWYLDAPGEKKGLLKILSPGPASMEALRFAPYNTVYFTNFNLDLSGAIEEGLRICDLFWEPARQMVDAHSDQLARKLGFDLRRDFLGSLGPGISLSISMPSTGGLVPEILATIHLEDAPRFESCVQKLVSLSGGSLKSLQYDGKELKYLTIGKDIPFSPTYTIEGSTFYLAGAPLVLKEAIRNRSQGGKSLADNPKFQEVAAKLSQTPSSIEYIDLPRAVALLYATGAPFLQGLQGHVNDAGVPIDLALLPTTDALTKHLSAMGTTYSSTKDGLLSESYGPVGCGTLFALLSKVVNSLEAFPRVDKIVRHRRGHGAHEHAPPGGMVKRKDRPAPPPARSGGMNPPGGTNPQQVFQAAFALHGSGKYDEAIVKFQKAAEQGFLVQVCYYNVACGYSLKNEKETALDWLGKALEAGFDNSGLLATDSDLDNIRQEPRFKELMTKHRR